MPFDPTTYPTPVIPAQAPDKDAEILLRAAEIIEERGWCQRSFGDYKRGPKCAAGAIIEAAHDAHRGGRVHELIRRAKPTGDHLMLWNDADGRTAAEVVARLRGAAHAR